MLANISMDIILEMFFLIFSDINIWFVEKTLNWSSYNIIGALFTIKIVEFISKKKFITVAIDENFETFIVYITSTMNTISIYLAKKA